MPVLAYKLKKKVKAVLPRFFIGALVIHLYVTYCVYYVNQIQCQWPPLSNVSIHTAPLFALILADIYLSASDINKTGSFWYGGKDRLWQMQSTFQAAISIHKPEIVFMLGDVIYDGASMSDTEFDNHVALFKRIFDLPESVKLYIIAGNQDIGSHNVITTEHLHRYEKLLSSPPVQLLNVRGNYLVLINSMAMEGDGCTFCARAMADIENITDIMKCTSGSSLCKSKINLGINSKPIILQHYPLYRSSDIVCSGEDIAPLSHRKVSFVEGRDCLSRESTELLVDSLRPRAVFGAHTHFSCLIRHTYEPQPQSTFEVMEYTLASFSWRNRRDPRYYLMAATPNEVKVSKCVMLTEDMMMFTYVVLMVVFVMYLKYSLDTVSTRRLFRRWR